MDLKQEMQQYAAELGFAQVGVTDLSPFVDWEKHVAAQVKTESAAVDAKYFASRPAEQWPWARSILVAMYPFPPGPSGDGDEERMLGGFSAYYKWSNVAHQQIDKLAEWLRERGFLAETDAVLPLKSAGLRAGLGYYGHNGLLHHTTYGSLVNLQAIVTDASLELDAPLGGLTDCGDCRNCIDACPTGAISAESGLSVRKCLRYWQDREAPYDIRARMGLRIQGCDTCQSVCPRNYALLANSQTVENPYSIPALLTETGERRKARMAQIAELVGDNYARPGRLSALAAIAAGNLGNAALIPALTEALQNENEQTQRMAAWALGRLGAELTLPDALLVEYEEGKKAQHDV